MHLKYLLCCDCLLQKALKHSSAERWSVLELVDISTLSLEIRRNIIVYHQNLCLACSNFWEHLALFELYGSDSGLCLNCLTLVLRFDKFYTWKYLTMMLLQTLFNLAHRFFLHCLNLLVCVPLQRKQLVWVVPIVDLRLMHTRRRDARWERLLIFVRLLQLLLMHMIWFIRRSELVGGRLIFTRRAPFQDLLAWLHHSRLHFIYAQRWFFIDIDCWPGEINILPFDLLYCLTNAFLNTDVQARDCFNDVRISSSGLYLTHTNQLFYLLGSMFDFDLAVIVQCQLLHNLRRDLTVDLRGSCKLRHTRLTRGSVHDASFEFELLNEVEAFVFQLGVPCVF